MLKKTRIIGGAILTLALTLIMSSTTFAADYQPTDPDDQGKTGIVGGDTLTFSEDTVWTNLTARWGVKVIFQDSDDYGNTVFKEEVLPVTDTENANTTAPDDPSHDEVTFTGWKRIDSNNGTSELSDDGAVTGVNGPGPIIYQAEYSNTTEEPGTTPDDPDKPGTTLDDWDKPGNTPDDSDKPEKTPADRDAPKTGDNMNIALWLGAMLASLFGLIVLAVRKTKAFNKFIQMMLVVTLIGGMGLTGLGAKAFAADTGADFTYGSYSMTYLPGTEGTVTNMPENETGLTPGADSPYTVSSTVPVRKGFEFIDWKLTWGTMEKPETPVDYSNALTVSKKATAAAAGDVNTARAYTITLEAKVNISATNASGLYVENLTVTDTIEDEFVLNSVKAELLDSAGGVVSSQSVSAAGPTVTHDFGNVQNGQTARLTLEVVAQSDFIGSNGVYTNVGLSSWTYKHTEPNATAAEDYSVSCADKPQVNVPIVFSVNERGRDDSAKLTQAVTFDGTSIAAPAHNTAKKYDQTRGTFSYKWESNSLESYGQLYTLTGLPILDTVHINNGQPDVSEEAMNARLSNTWTIPNLQGVGDYEVKLHVTFTPDAATGEGAFANAITAEPVTAKTKDGHIIIKVLPVPSEIDIEPDF